jgi:hypothetical protein
VRDNTHDLVYQFFGLNSQDRRLVRRLSSTHARPRCRSRTLKRSACLRTRDGSFAKFQSSDFQHTFPLSISPAGVITAWDIDASALGHPQTSTPACTCWH